eukprot:766338-Hanusia_phi.AAC.5
MSEQRQGQRSGWGARTRQDKTEEDRGGQDRAGQGRSGDGRTDQVRGGQDRTGEGGEGRIWNEGIHEGGRSRSPRHGVVRAWQRQKTKTIRPAGRYRDRDRETETETETERGERPRGWRI